MHCPSTTALPPLPSLSLRPEKEPLEVMVADPDENSSFSRSSDESCTQKPQQAADARPVTPPLVDKRELSSRTVSTKRIIRFDDKENVIIPIYSMKPSSLMSETEKSQIWWQEGDYDHFKRTARLIGSEVQRRQSANHNKSSYSSIMLRTYAACCNHRSSDPANTAMKLSDADKRSLQHWAAVGICRRGLERWCMPRMAKDRHERKLIAIRGVVATQQKMDPGLSSEMRWEALRIRSERLSRSSRLYALALGEADATTSLPDDQPNLCPKKMLLTKRNSMAHLGGHQEQKIYGPSSA